jgi:hypothetical protein
VPSPERHWEEDDGSESDASVRSFWALDPTEDNTDLTASLFRDRQGNEIRAKQIALNALVSTHWGDYEYSRKEKERRLNDALNEDKATFYDSAFARQIRDMEEDVRDCMIRPEKPIGITWRTKWLASRVTKLAKRQQWIPAAA